MTITMNENGTEVMANTPEDAEVLAKMIVDELNSSKDPLEVLNALIDADAAVYILGVLNGDRSKRQDL